MKAKIAVYPGSFDPVTNGHMDVIERAMRIFDKVVVAVGDNLEKKSLFSVDERVDILKKVTKGLKGVEVKSFSGLLLDFVKREKASVIIRGLRAVSDFEFEFQRALMNRKVDSKVETIFIMTKGSYCYLNSSIVKEMAQFGGCVTELVPKLVEKKLKEKFK
ncbi:MAG: pantetheine-phosphate adenylyltransferase [Candidatus Woesearchaeota archaeon]|jgi:pantetheine-phosphate adenylyltransferase|nr:pantetheine-phosphate adenylyltransferase [Candidatus Woesearchaeota archaeon]